MSMIANSTIRNLGSGSDDDTVDEDRNILEGNKENKVNEETEIDALKVKKKARNIKPFTEDILTLPLGLQRIYEEFPQSCKFRGTKGSEAKDIKKMMMMYHEWAFQLHPGLSYTDVLIKTEQLGGKGKVRSYVQNLRERERDRYVTDVLGVKVNDINEEILNLDKIHPPSEMNKDISLNRDQSHISTRNDIINTSTTTATVPISRDIAVAESLPHEIDYSDLLVGIVPWESDDYMQTNNEQQSKYELDSEELITSPTCLDIDENQSTMAPQIEVPYYLDSSPDSFEEVLTSPEAR